MDIVALMKENGTQTEYRKMLGLVSVQEVVVQPITVDTIILNKDNSFRVKKAESNRIHVKQRVNHLED